MRTIAALFDFDGVIMDTEAQYTLFWNEQGSVYLGENNFGYGIKGQTLTQIYNKYFLGKEAIQQEITDKLDEFEKHMYYEYIPGVKDFIIDMKRNCAKIAIVTSSNEKKMKNVYHAHPELKELVDCILTSEMFIKSKPSPDCFLAAMKLLDISPENTYVFEDSFHGLQAGIASGATVIGLATTNSRDDIKGKAHFVIDDFVEMTYDKLLAL